MQEIFREETFWRSSSDEALLRLSADTVDTLNALTETVGELDALKAAYPSYTMK